MQLIVQRLSGYWTSFCVSYSYLTFLRSPFMGFILICLSLINPTSTILSLIAYCSDIILGKLVNINRENKINSLYAYNSILVGLAIGFLFELSYLSVLMTIFASFLALMLSYSLSTIFYTYLGLPILNIPFTITASLIYLASMRYSNMFIAKSMEYASLLDITGLPITLSGLFKAVGILLFLPYDLVGIAILAAMFFYSRINFFLMVSGYYVGILFVAMLKGSIALAVSEVYSFNFIIISMALGGYFLIPSAKSYLIAFCGVIVSVFVLDAASIFWSSYGIPVFTFPFIVIVMLVLYVLRSSRFNYITIAFFRSPELMLEHYLNYTNRFNVLYPQPYLPFNGQWKVYQAFDDQWTHKGLWKHAIDFIMVNPDDNSSFRNMGLQLDDYYCYGQPILSPISGVVIACHDGLADNPIGLVDKENYWGNYVLIKSYLNYTVLICHLNQNSLSVKAGDTVVVGQTIANCGNSGYSPLPHIHIQCQLLPYLGVPTIPFRFTSCSADGVTLFGTRELVTGQTVKSVSVSDITMNKFMFILDETFSFEVMYNQKKHSSLTIKVVLEIDGTYHFLESQTNSKLYFSLYEGVFSFFKYEGSSKSCLRFLYLCLPRLPLTMEQVQWTDHINPLLLGKLTSSSTFIKSFNHTLFQCLGSYRFTAIDTIEGSITARSLRGKTMVKTECVLDHFRGFNRLSVLYNNESFSLIKTGVAA
ncbi:MAG: urea transporter [Chitinivibrionales bacterium]|nr:urea transporter [Chitinivibrionales bacterium]